MWISVFKSYHDVDRTFGINCDKYCGLAKFKADGFRVRESIGDIGTIAGGGRNDVDRICDSHATFGYAF